MERKMSKAELALENAKIIFNGCIEEKNISINNGKISKISNSGISAEQKIDCKKKFVFPGLIDPHVHMREPGLDWKEDWKTGSRAAAAGGFATVLDMPNNKPPITSVKELEKKRKIVAKKSIVNFGFHFGASADNIGEIKKAWESNIASVKVFMNHSTGKMMIENSEALHEIFDFSKRVSVHAEEEKVKLALSLQKNAENELYLCHISTAQELGEINECKRRNVFVEATPHHLFLSKENEKNVFFRMKPSLKSKEDQQALWNAIESGLVSAIGSDHAPHTKEEKEKDAPFGVPGLETTLPLLLNAFNQKRISLQKIQELCAENPARIFGIKEKGIIEKGMDADFTIVDLKKEQVVENENLFTKCKWSPFAGIKLKGVAEKTIIGGELIFDNGKIVNNKKGREAVFE
jgi:dihydroorotase